MFLFILIILIFNLFILGLNSNGNQINLRSHVSVTKAESLSSSFAGIRFCIRPLTMTEHNHFPLHCITAHVSQGKTQWNDCANANVFSASRAL